MGVQERGNGVIDELLHASFAPRVFPNALGGRYEGVSDKRSVVLWDVGERVKGNRVLAVRDVEVEYVLCALVDAGSGARARACRGDQ